MQIKEIIIFITILILASVLRFTGINWDSNAHLNPDERFLTMVSTDIAWPKNFAAYFNTRASPLNPHNAGHGFYVYGTYPVYLTKFVAGLFNRDTYDGIPLVGRTLSGIVDIVTLIVVFLIAKRLSSTSAGLLAMFIYAIMVLPIQLSHFYTVDPYTTLFLTISIYLLIKKHIGWQLGIAVGLAVAAKISSVLILPIVVLLLWKRRTGFWFFFSLIATVRLAYPYLFDGWHLNQLVLDNWGQLKAFDGVETGFPPALQWIGVPFWKPTWDMIVHGLGLPLGILALISLFIRPNLLLLSWIIIVLGYQSFQFAKAMRYLYPIYPALAVLLGIFLMRAFFFLSKRFHPSLIRLPARHRCAQALAGGFAYSLISLFLLWALAFVSIYTRPHTRIAASDWIYQNVPAGVVLAWEHWDDPLPLSRNTNHIGIYKTRQLPMYDPDSIEKWQQLTETLVDTDYIVLSSNRVYGGVAHAKNRYPQTNRYYTLLFSNQLGFEKIAEFTSRPTLFGLEFIDDNAEESFTVYDHPKVTIYINKERKTQEELYTLIINGQQ